MLPALPTAAQLSCSAAANKHPAASTPSNHFQSPSLTGLLTDKNSEAGNSQLSLRRQVYIYHDPASPPLPVSLSLSGETAELSLAS